MSLRIKVIKAIAWSAGLQWGEQIIGFSVFFVLARLLGPEDFGVITLASVFIGFLQIFNSQGISQAIVQKKEIQVQHLDTAFWMNLVIGCVLCLGVNISSSSIASIFDEPELAPVLNWLSLSFIILALNSTQGSILERNLEFKKLAIRSFVGVFFGGVVGLSMAFLGYGIWSLVGQRLTNMTVGLCLLWWVSDWRPGLRVSINHIKELLPFAASITGLNFLSFVMSNSDSLLIGYFIGTAPLGYYNVAYRITQILVTLVAGVTSKVSLSAFAKLQENTDRFLSAFYETISLTSLFVFPIFFGIFILAPELIVSMFGSEWQQSVSLLQVLSWLGILQCITWIQSSALTAIGKPNVRLVILLINAALTTAVFATYLQYGIMIATLAFVITSYLMSIIPVLVLQKFIGMEITKYFEQFLAPISCAVLMTVSIFLTKVFVSKYLLVTNIWIQICVSALIGAMVFFAVLKIIFPNRFGQITALIGVFSN